ncbi:Tuberous sclerosis 2-like protein [Gaertneriomyces sp. JEL0708]|nr:Tuberous sclerosis 2-like protein [Gaertneriomyces sp. JEL0708]
MSNPLERLKQKFKSRLEWDDIAPSNSAARKSSSNIYQIHHIFAAFTPDASIQQQIEGLRTLATLIPDVHLENEIEQLWELVRPLAGGDHAWDVRKSVLEFIHVCVTSQSVANDLMRLEFYRTATADDWGHEEFPLRLRIVCDLTKDGRDLRELEDDILNKLVGKLSAFEDMSGLEETITTELDSLRMVMAFATNIVKFSFISLQEAQVVRLIESACLLRQLRNETITNDILLLLDAVVRYGSVPISTLPTVAATLSEVAGAERLTDKAWQIMRNLLMSHAARRAMDALEYEIRPPALVLPSPAIPFQPTNVRGALFLIAMANWGSQRVANLAYPYVHVLRLLRHAAEYAHDSIDVEILTALRRLITRFGTNLSVVDWDLILDIMVTLSQSAVPHTSQKVALFDEVLRLLQPYILETPSLVSCLFVDILLGIGIELPEQTVLDFLEHLMGAPLYALSVQWTETLQRIVKVFYINEKRQLIRWSAIQHLCKAYLCANQVDRDDMFELIITPVIRNLPYETNRDVFVTALEFLISISNDCGDKELTTIIEGLVQCTLNTHSLAISSVLMLAELLSAMAASATVAVTPGTASLTDSMALRALQALLCIFEICAAQKGGQCCLLIFKYLVRIPTFEHAPENVRLACLDYLLGMRADQYHRISVKSQLAIWRGPLDHLSQSGDASTYRTFSNLSCYNRIASTSVSVSDDHSANEEFPCVLPVAQHAAAIILQLTRAQTWNIYSFILENLPSQLYNARFFQGAGPQLTVLRSFFCEMITKERAAATVQDLPANVRKSDIYLMGLRVLTILLAYRHLFTRQDQDELLNAFKTGLHRWPTTAKHCIQSITVALLDMPQSMTKALPAILLKVSQMMSSAMAVHNLEFLATLARLPQLRVNFTDADMKRVFVIALQYVNSATNAGSISAVAMSAYVVQLAYQVLLAWFVTLKLTERKKYVPFIIHYLLLGNDKDHTTLDENVELVLDMLIHNSFADCWPKPPDTGQSRGSPITPQRLPSRSWIQGNSILTVQLSDQPDWANVTVRRPSGIITFAVRLENRFRYEDSALFLSAPIAMERHRRPHLVRKNTTDDGSGTPSMKRSDSDTNALGLAMSRRHQRAASIASIHGFAESPAVLETRVKSDSSIAGPSIDPYLQESGTPEGSPSGVRRSRSTSMTSMSAAAAEGLEALRRRHAPSFEKIEESQLNQSPPGLRERTSTALAVARSLGEHQAMDPSFILAQLVAYPNVAASELLVPLSDDDATTRGLSVLDRTPVVDLHKIGIVYAGPGQTTEAAILANKHGSRQYGCFLRSVGKLIRLKNCKDIYTGGLDTAEDLDGKFAIYAQDELSQVIFHCTTLMPEFVHDPLCTGKKRHIGNDFVTIVWNESGTDYAFDTIPAQFNYVNIIIEPVGALDMKEPFPSPGLEEFHRSYFKVHHKVKPDMADVGPLPDVKLISGESLGVYVRQLAVHGNIFSQIFMQSATADSTYASNARERLRQIKRVKQRAETAGSRGSTTSLLADTSPTNGEGNVMESLLDFTRIM